jgi:stage IV sporulation protein FB
MAWEDRPHYRDHSGASANPLVWLMSGSVPLGSALGVRIRAHSSLIVFALASLMLSWFGPTIPMRLMGMVMWVAMLVLHEMAHCIVARRLGGFADEAILWPAGGLTTAEAPHRAAATFATAIAGPAVNFFLAMWAGIGVYLLTPIYAVHGTEFGTGMGHVIVSLNPFHAMGPDFAAGWRDPAMYCWWIFAINYRLLLLNLLPIFPLDGGQILHTVLWPMVGHFRSLMIETSVGMAGAVAVGLVSLAMQGWLLAFCMMFCVYQAYQRRMVLNEGGGEDWRDSFDFSSSLFTDEKPKRKRLSRRVIRKARRIAQQEKAVRDRIDEILAKVSKTGMPSLTWVERRALKKATQQCRRSETELSKFQ